jgi:hypothetical protein
MSTQCNTKGTRQSTRRRMRRRVRAEWVRSLDEAATNQEQRDTNLSFPAVGRRQVLASFDGGDISSDGGALLLRQTEELTGVIRQFAACFTDHRNPDLIEHETGHLIAQRILR